VSAPRVHVRFLGSGDAFGSGGRLQTSILVESGGFHALLDCGTTTLIGLKRAAIDPAAVDVILVSHLHGDHFGGIPFLLLDAQFSRRSRPLVVAGPPGLTERLRQAMEVFFPGSSRVERKFETRVVEMAKEVPTSLGPISVTPFEVRHESGAPAYALRLSLADRILAYSGDTEWTEALVKAAEGSDLFICEAYFYEKRVPFHLDYCTLLKHRNEIRTKRLVVTHMSADMLERLTELEIEAASDGRVVEL
jgi:ribonuclease BN (tRNA processing enzyme)